MVMKCYLALVSLPIYIVCILQILSQYYIIFNLDAVGNPRSVKPLERRLRNNGLLFTDLLFGQHMESSTSFNVI